MKTLTANMFAETNEDLPIISGMGRTELTETAAPAEMDNDTIVALAICNKSGLDAVRRLEEWLDDHRVSYFWRQSSSYQRGLMIYAASIGIEVHENPNVTYDGYYYLRDAIWARMNPAEQDYFRHLHPNWETETWIP